jgi:hypothetical protein
LSFIDLAERLNSIKMKQTNISQLVKRQVFLFLFLCFTLSITFGQTARDVVTTIAGNGTTAFVPGDAEESGFQAGGAIAFDSKGNTYFTSWGDGRIYRIVEETGEIEIFRG